MIDVEESDERQFLRELARLHAAERAPEPVRQRLIARLSAEPGLPRAPGQGAAPRWLALGLAAAVLLVAGVYRALGTSGSTLPVSAVSAEPPAPAAGKHGAPERAPIDCPQRRMHYAQETDPDVLRAGLTLHNFETHTESCGRITRRYLEYVPKGVTGDSPAPVVLLLHGGPDRAEGMRSIQTQRRFEALARRDGFIVVYASAVPSEDSDPNVPNEGRWRTAGFANPQVNDEEYLLQVVEDLLKRRVIDGTNPVFLVGHAEGARMALQAAAHRPDFYAGVASVMAYNFPPLPPDALPGARLSRVLFVALDATWRPGVNEWAAALGVTSAVIDAPPVLVLPDRVREGNGHASAGPTADSTRDSTVQRIDLRAPKREGPAVRVFDVHGAGHFWPTPAPHDSERLIESFGFRNEDIDTADEIWSFFSDQEASVPRGR